MRNILRVQKIILKAYQDAKYAQADLNKRVVKLEETAKDVDQYKQLNFTTSEVMDLLSNTRNFKLLLEMQKKILKILFGVQE